MKYSSIEIKIQPKSTTNNEYASYVLFTLLNVYKVSMPLVLLNIK